MNFFNIYLSGDCCGRSICMSFAPRLPITFKIHNPILTPCDIIVQILLMDLPDLAEFELGLSISVHLITTYICLFTYLVLIICDNELVYSQMIFEATGSLLVHGTTPLSTFNHVEVPWIANTRKKQHHNEAQTHGV